MASKFKTAAPAQEPKTAITPQTTKARLELSPEVLAPAQKPTTTFASKFKATEPAQEAETSMAPETTAAKPAPSPGTVTPTHKTAIK
ncbi:unnamed protein product, partial [Laminaria digitata]